MGLCGVLSKDDFGSDLRERARGIRESLLEKGKPQGCSIPGEGHCRQREQDMQMSRGAKAHAIAREP